MRQMAGKNQTNKITALYCRFSKDDGTLDESSSIQTQKTMLSKYAADHGYRNTQFFVDDGYSGMNFNRPAFRDMIAEINAGNIERVITKDLSRLGRNYLETGACIEVFFPEHHVQYIAINDGVDSSSHQTMDITPFKNILNELYAADISKKIRSAKKARSESGLYVATAAPYGYRKDPEDRHHLVIDERYAPIVRQIFQWALDGDGIQKIRKRLIEQKIPRPGACSTINYEKCGITKENQHEWSNNSVRSILRNPVYAGHLISGKRPTLSLKSKRRGNNAPNDCIIARNTHEAIIPQDKYDLVQALITSRRKNNKKEPFSNLFAGLVKCADCGYALTLTRAHRKQRDNLMDCYIYMCNQYKIEGVAGCTQHKIEARDLYEAVLHDIQFHAKRAVLDDEAFLRSLVKKLDSDQQEQQKQLRIKARKGAQRLEELDRLYEQLYEDRAAGRISERNFSRLSAKYEQEQDELELLIQESERVQHATRAENRNAEEFLKLIRPCTEITELTAALLHTLIDKITVSEAESDENGKFRQKITIYYKFIGLLDQ